MGLHLSQIDEADELLTNDPLALLIGMVLDQQFPLERAFAAPYELTRRLGRPLDVEELATFDPEALSAIFAQPPALHRFPGSMAKRVQAMCQVLVDRYDGDPTQVWGTAADGGELLKRIGALPGFGAQKAKIFVALLGKQLGVTPPGWREATAPYGEEGSRRSVADITGPDTLLEVREFKKQMKAAAKASAG
ncbi:putative HhH-GPD family protein [Frankia sp. EI5c]|uniref:HhH-GPD-type base excision DNA repair protein n=1 Tax=Frankia sp. EI5c TaxID=683316 RepID=UPI0007C33A9F|nr:HhH-GPD-type base excision DNA repair protein [Frankia sp. EI5c]OAA23485.1 putative HhH-GPD family protein [Frankia sp. EI5c]